MSEDFVETVISAVSEGAIDLHTLPLPPEIKKSLFKAVGSLITGLADVPAAWLESKARAIRADASAQAIVTMQAGHVAAAQLDVDPALTERAASHFTARLNRGQANREAVVRGAAVELAQHPIVEDAAGVIDDDWLEMFASLAEQLTNPEMQTYFSRLLAGEIRKPGAFSPRTMQVMATLTPARAALFSAFCDLAYVWPAPINVEPMVITAPFGAAGENSLRPLGFSYQQLLSLQEAGLIAHDLNSWNAFVPAWFLGDRTLGSMPVQFGFMQPFDKAKLTLPGPRVQVILFSEAGRELFPLVSKGLNQAYIDKFIPWVEQTYGLVHLKQ